MSNKYTPKRKESNKRYKEKLSRIDLWVTPEEKELTVLTENSFFGDMGMVSSEPRSATAVTLEDDTIVEIIRPEDLDALFEKNPPKAAMIINQFSYRLRKLTNDYLDACEQVAQYEK